MTGHDELAGQKKPLHIMTQDMYVCMCMCACMCVCEDPGGQMPGHDELAGQKIPLHIMTQDMYVCVCVHACMYDDQPRRVGWAKETSAHHNIVYVCIHAHIL